MKRVMLMTISLIAVCGLFIAGTGTDRAVAAVSGVVIAQVQAGSSSGATQEYVALYNNSVQDINVTNWCIVYTSSSGSTANKPGCITTPDSQTQLWLSAHSYTLFASTDFVKEYPGFMPDAAAPFVAGLSDTAGTLTLKDADSVEQDKFTWSAKATTGNIYVRKFIAGSTTGLLDTDQITDFELSPLVTPSTTGLYEVVLPTDVCPNIDGLQIEIPAGYLQDSAGLCQYDVCQNMDGLQISIPDGYESLDGENCTLIPLENATIYITELLPNAASYDTGKEFIELYNPNNRAVSLKDYALQTGPSFLKSFPLVDTVLQPGEYKSFSDTVTGLVLPNTSASVRLVAAAGNIVSTVPDYYNPADDESWALIDDIWQYTNQATPGSANKARLTDGGLEGGSGGELVVPVLSPCPAGKYRNPVTNRCRNIETVVSSLSPCDEDEYRNPETNRCRKIATLASSSLTPCKEGQERNPETNRCRNIASSTESDLKPCGEDEERNPETNRCRKKSTSAAVNPIGQLSSASNAVSINRIALGVGILATLGYGLWEYRLDLQNFWIRTRRRFFNHE